MPWGDPGEMSNGVAALRCSIGEASDVRNLPVLTYLALVMLAEL